MFCFDTGVGALKKQGYSIFRLPREDVDPLQLVMRVGQRYEQIGELNSLLTSRTNALPEDSSRNKVCRDQRNGYPPH